MVPAHEVYQVLVDIWSRGCNPTLHYALPILFALEVSGLILSGLGVHRRAHYATIKEEMEKEAFQLRIDKAFAHEQQRDEQIREEKSMAPVSIPESEVPAKDLEENREQKDRKEFENVIGQTDVELQKRRNKVAQDMRFGPSFGFNFGCEDPSKKAV
jgi:hypothetical protein